MNYLKLLNQEKMTLITSLPQNDINLAKAAIEAGSDAVKVHVNVSHRASGNHFGTFEEEYIENLKDIVELCKKNNIPIGIVPGGDDNIPMNEIEKVIESGFDFISLYDKHMNPMVLKNKNIYKMVALTNEYKLEWIKAYDNLPIDVLECSIMDPETYGTPMTVREILKYQSVRNNTIKPIVISTQRKIMPEQLWILNEMGINSIMIGAVVTGKDVEQFYKNTKDFRKAIDNL
ncbi:hypothetical protein C7380_105145 [Oceanotoga teriensis]|uniref:Uncharacterized protein n=1 Tax=Oceanotoga teriensis TaxID=515440 RepID=A0AA45C7L8_9BACT|nr:hypothetical protein [Oceanotoga teriensis]PWJ95515.1 hypothetical protein C7380_105145 [Oceanotoga teriensis]